jgi:hypothetical protein
VRACHPGGTDCLRGPGFRGFTAAVLGAMAVRGGGFLHSGCTAPSSSANLLDASTRASSTGVRPVRLELAPSAGFGRSRAKCVPCNPLSAQGPPTSDFGPHHTVPASPPKGLRKELHRPTVFGKKRPPEGRHHARNCEHTHVDSCRLGCDREPAAGRAARGRGSSCRCELADDGG